MMGRSEEIAVVSAAIVMGEPSAIKARECVFRDVRLDIKRFIVNKVKYQLIYTEKEFEE